MKTMKRISAVSAFAFLLLLLACKKGEGGHCYTNKECKDDFVCASETHECATLEKANSICAASSLCKALGNCHANHKVGAEDFVLCIAKSEDDCAQADCAKNGCKFVASAMSCQK